MLPEIQLSECTYIAAFLTLRCNYRCSYCINRHGAFKPRHEMTAEEWITGLNRLCIDRSRMVPVTLQGGEPTVHPHWAEIVGGIKEELYLDMLTNLTFGLDEFCMAAPPSRWERDVPYAPIRASYHPEFSSYNDLLDKASKLQMLGYDVGVFVVEHPTVNAPSLKKKAEKYGVDFRTKELLGRYEGRLYGKYKYPEAVRGERLGVTVECRTTELLIAPDGYIHRCHRDLYAGEHMVGHILDRDLKVEFKFRECGFFGCCSECDQKVKNDRFQRPNAISVQIMFDK